MGFITPMESAASSTVAAAVANGAAATSSTTALAALGASKNIVGSAWIVSSALLTTYSTTSFLKYRGQDELGEEAGDLQSRMTKENRKGLPEKPIMSRPTLLTLYRFSGSLLLGLFLHQPLLAVLDRVWQTVGSVQHFALPAAFLFVANYANSISLDRIGISLTYTSKCGIPLITVLITLLLDGVQAMPAMPTLLSLVPIAMGIAAASWNHPTFEPLGFAAAMISCLAQAALNVSSKKVMIETGISGPDAQRAMVAVALGITLLMSGINHVRHVTREEPALEGERAKLCSMSKEPALKKKPPSWLAGLAVIAYHIEYCLSFMFVKLVEPITFGTCDAIRRLAIIVSGHNMFGGEPFSKLNIAGIALSLAGALLYAISSAGGFALMK